MKLDDRSTLNSLYSQSNRKRVCDKTPRADHMCRDKTPRAYHMCLGRSWLTGRVLFYRAITLRRSSSSAPIVIHVLGRIAGICINGRTWYNGAKSAHYPLHIAGCGQD